MKKIWENGKKNLVLDLIFFFFQKFGFVIY